MLRGVANGMQYLAKLNYVHKVSLGGERWRGYIFHLLFVFSFSSYFLYRYLILYFSVKSVSKSWSNTVSSWLVVPTQLDQTICGNSHQIHITCFIPFVSSRFICSSPVQSTLVSKYGSRSLTLLFNNTFRSLGNSPSENYPNSISTISSYSFSLTCRYNCCAINQTAASSNWSDNNKSRSFQQAAISSSSRSPKSYILYVCVCVCIPNHQSNNYSRLVYLAGWSWGRLKACPILLYGG